MIFKVVIKSASMKKKIKSIIAYYSIFLGVTVLLMWTFILVSKDIEEGKREMLFHLFSEVLMAVLSITSGFVLLKKGKSNLIIAAHAMVIYSVLNAAGYYLEKGEQLMTSLFLILFLLSLTILTFITLKFDLARK